MFINVENYFNRFTYRYSGAQNKDIKDLNVRPKADE